jgi:hypothetical protein
MDAPIRSGPFSPAEVDTFLDGAVIPMRLATVSPTGWPTVVSLWFLREGDELWAATRPTSALAAFLAETPRCAFEIAGDEPPYRGVRGRADVVLDAGAGGPVLERLLTRYLGGTEGPLARNLLARAADEVHLRLRPRSLVSWDYSVRMSGTAAGPG